MTEPERNTIPYQFRATCCKRVFRQTAQWFVENARSVGNRYGNLLLGEKEINETALEDLETALLTTDVGLETTQAIMSELTDRAGRRELANMGSAL